MTLQVFGWWINAQVWPASPYYKGTLQLYLLERKPLVFIDQEWRLNLS